MPSAPIPRIATLLLAFGAAALPAVAQTPERPDVQQLQLGAGIDSQPGPFRDFACGTDGGPPSVKIGGFAEFLRCPLEARTGLHEVAFRYDDELEYYALAMNLKPIADRYGGTRFGSFPVIVSALFDDEGILQGYRVVTDDRVSLRERRAAYGMGRFAKSQFPDGELHCRDLPPADRETPLGNLFVKQDCTITTPQGGRAELKTRLLHRPGQAAVDPHSGEKRSGSYESAARLEVFAPGWEPQP